ncbi:MAG: PRD domain-containing protein [Trichococcus sp.]|nr:PRD domain-containing protein [Trichococcus sp.]
MSTANDRELLLRSLLSNKETDLQSLEEASGKNKYQIKTIISELNDVYEGFLKIQQKDESKVGIVRKEGANIFNTLHYNIHQDFNKVECRIAYLLYRLICTEEYLNIGDLSEEMSVSRSTVNNDLKKLKQLLEKYNAKVVGIPNKGITFQCSEFGTRLVLIYEVFELLQMTFLPDQEIQDALDGLVRDYKLDEQAKELLYKALAVSVHRLAHGHTIDSEIPMYKNFEADSANIIAYTQLLQKKFAVALNDHEIAFLAFPINTRNSAYVKGSENSENEEVLRQVVSSMLKTVRDQVMIEIDEEAFFDKVKYHLLFLINRLVFRIPNTDLYLEQIKLKYPLAFELAKISLSELNRLYQLRASADDISYLAVYYALMLDERQANDSKGKSTKDVGIITNLGRGSFELISRQIKEIVGNEMNIVHLNTDSLPKEKLKRFRLLFTTEEISVDTEVPVIKIDRLVSPDDLAQKIYAVEKDQYNIKYLTNEDISYHLVNLKGQMGYFDYVEEITSYLSRRYRLSEDILDRFVEKEERHTMIYENKVAFPHLTDPNINKLVFVLGNITMANRNDAFSLMLFLVTPEKISEQQERILMQVYDFVFKVINDPTLINDLKKVDDAQGLIEMLEKRGTK